MVDGRVVTMISPVTSATTSCSICGLTCSKLNNLSLVEKVASKLPDDMFKHGLSTLHLWIRSMECCLHISYRMEIKKWQARKEDKEVVKEKQRKVQKELRQALGINVDIPKSGGSGTSNDGNTARTFFKHYKESARWGGRNGVRIWIHIKTERLKYTSPANMLHEIDYICLDTHDTDEF